MYRKYFVKKFAAYPDVVTLKQLSQMLGGICTKTAVNYLKRGLVDHYRIGGKYYIPKACVIDFLVESNYGVTLYMSE